jgi:hypothetical protein
MRVGADRKQYDAAVERFRAARAEIDAYERNRAGSIRASEFSPTLHMLRIAEAEAALAIDQDAAALNRTASDTESLRVLLETELRVARKVHEQPAPAEPAPLESAEPEAILARVAAALEYREAYTTYQASLAGTAHRLAAVWRALADAQALLGAARKAQHLPAPKPVLPNWQGAASFVSTPPISVETIDQCLAMIQAQREPRHGERSAAEHRLYTLRRELEQYERDQAEAEAKREDAGMTNAEKQAAIWAAQKRAAEAKLVARDADARSRGVSL